MDQVKIGKLIARLRKNKNLTQQALGDIMGVGHQAVSKWERGNCLPDISIINKLCEVLDITSDELLKGELNEENKIYLPTKNKLKYLWFLPVLILIIIACIILFLNKAKEPPVDTDVYILRNAENGYYVSGQLVHTEDKLTIIINNIEFDNQLLNETTIKNYQYELLSEDTFIYGYGRIGTHELLDAPKAIDDFLKVFKFEYKIENQNKINKIINNNLILKFTFLTENDEIITKDIEIKVNSPSK